MFKAVTFLTVEWLIVMIKHQSVTNAASGMRIVTEMLIMVTKGALTGEIVT